MRKWALNLVIDGQRCSVTIEIPSFCRLYVSKRANHS